MAAFDFKTLLLPAYNVASITTWNRLDSYPRTPDIGRGLKCEVRDAMWMLTRQWQFGEFNGEDAGSPVFAKISGLHRTPDAVLINDQPIPYNNSIPLEAIVEREAVKPTLRLRVQMGRMFHKLLKLNKSLPAQTFFLKNFQLPDLTNNEDGSARMFYEAVAGRVVDGFEIYKRAGNNPAGFFDGMQTSGLTAISITTLKNIVLPQFIKWFDQLYFQAPENKSAWQPQRMEYNFKVNVPLGPTQKASLNADEYPGGRLDWTAFDFISQTLIFGVTGFPEVGEQIADVFLPSIVNFKGMPNPRFWQMEAGNMDFGKIEKSPAGIVGLLLAEYGLTYSNNWFLLPYPAKINSTCSIQGIIVTDVFGKRIFVGPAGMTNNNNWQDFTLFNITKNNQPASKGQLFYLPPVVSAMQESEPLERVYFMRDEMANLMWAIEDIIPAETGGGKKIIQVAPPDPVPNPNPETWRYTLGTTVPEHWIPFVAVHKPGSEKEIRFQRARIPNTKPASSVLLTENQPVHFIEEQEVPRCGVIVERSVQRIRWMNGRTFLWVGRRKITGRGEGSSSLTFDNID
jgi:hypothetical protein